MKPYVFAPLFFQKLIWIPTRLVLKVFGSHKVYGLENLQGITTPIIFACNHSSEIDPFMAPASLPFFSQFSPLFYAIREKSFYQNNGWRKHLFNPWFIALWGGYNAPSGLRDYENSLARHIQILRDGKSFCIFPEGGITKDGKLRPAKGGISFLAHSAPCVIVPMGVSHVYGMSPLDFFTRKRKIHVRFGKPINPEQLFGLIEQPHASGESVWRKEAEYIMGKVGELIES